MASHAITSCCVRATWVGMFVAVGAAAGQSPLWERQFGTSRHELLRAGAPDGAGGLFVGGGTFGHLGGVNAGRLDAWLARYNDSGDQIWVRQFGTSVDDGLEAIAADSTGGAFVGGFTDGDLGGTSAGDRDAWLARYDSDGDQVWIVQRGSVGFDGIARIAPDGSGGVFVCGYTSGDIGGSNAGDFDAWIARYDEHGRELWIRQLGTGYFDIAQAIAFDGSGGAYVTGSTSHHLGGVNRGLSDVWLARYGASGEQIWIRQFGTQSSEAPFGIAVDASANVYLGGLTTGAFYPGVRTGGADAWLSKFDGAGNQIWIRQFGTDADDAVRGVATDAFGGVFVCGETHGNLGGLNIGMADAWLARFDDQGRQVWLRQFGTTVTDAAQVIVTDFDGRLYLGGSTEGDLAGPGAGDGDVWIARWTTDSSCYPDCDQSTGPGVLDIFDFLCFGNRFTAGDPYACDCDTSTGPGICDIFDFLCFGNAFSAGCP